MQALQLCYTCATSTPFSVPPHIASPAALCKSCIKRLPGAIKGCLVLASSCVIAASLQTPASAIITRGTSIYKIVQGPSWFTSEANAVRLGGHLTAISSQDENSFIKSNFTDVLFPPPNALPNAPPTENLWIGLSDYVQEGDFRWSNGEPLTYQNWNAPEPNNLDNQDFVQMYSNGEWDDYDLRFNGYYEVSMGVAEIPFQSFNGNAYVRVQGNTLQDAIANALELGGTIVDNSDPTELAWLASAFSGEPTDRIARIPFSGSSASVPGPLPLFGAAAAFGFSRKLRRRIQGR